MIRNGTFTDVSCGFRAYTRDTALRLNLFGRFTYTQESFIDLASKEVRMTEVPLRVRGVRQFGQSRVASNLWRYAFQTLPIIARAMRDTRPLTFFGILALAFFLLGCLQAGFVSGWWLATGKTAPWSSLVTIGAACIIISILVGTMALIADQLGRVRRVQEELLTLARRAHYIAPPVDGGLADRADAPAEFPVISAASREPAATKADSPAWKPDHAAAPERKTVGGLTSR